MEAAAGLLAEQKHPSLVGHSVSHYQVLSLIGAGGMGEVYLAEDTRLGRKVALKMLPRTFTGDQDRVRRFEQEARAASALNHPNILTIHEVGVAGETHFIATEFIDGQTLRERMRDGRLELAESLDIAIQAASALAAAHEAGITHRDIKPENVMVRRDGIVKVLDFGLAKLSENRLTERLTATGGGIEKRAPASTAEGVVMGTVNYMSPEQARGQKVDARSDTFSLGVTLYEMVAGAAPFTGVNAVEVLAAILNKKPPPLRQSAPDAPRELERIIDLALRKDRAERYQHVKDLLKDLKALKQELEFAAKASGANEGAPARKTSSSKIILGEIRCHKLGVTLTLAAVALATVAWLIYRDRQPALTEKDTILLADFVNNTGDAVFDGTLKEALAAHLGQSPFLNILSVEQVRESLRYMNHSPDERVTRALARDICQRQGLKALLAGSISSFGRNYAITMEAVNAQTGEVIARELVEAEGKEQVLKAMGQSATRLREKLGESLVSIRKFDVPIEQATTSSLEALKSFSVAMELFRQGKRFESIPHYNRAIALDPNFASAYTWLEAAYRAYDSEKAVKYGKKAFELRERVSEREKLFISMSYYTGVTGELDKQIEIAELRKVGGPRIGSLAYRYIGIGQYEKAVEEAREDIRLNPYDSDAYAALSRALIRLGRFEDAREICERVPKQNLDFSALRNDLYSVAFVQGDAGAMRRQIDWATGRKNEYLAFQWQARTAAFAGQLSRAREFSREAIDMAERGDLKQVAADETLSQALTEATVGHCPLARRDAGRALDLAPYRYHLAMAARVLALCGETVQAQNFAAQVSAQYPKDTRINTFEAPLIRAAVELHHRNPDEAIKSLQTTGSYSGSLSIHHGISRFWPVYLRGQAYLRKKAGTEAAAEFQKILDHRGWDPTSHLYPLAHLGLARAAALAGDRERSRKSYQDFFALWKDADTDLPALIEAKKEYENRR